MAERHSTACSMRLAYAARPTSFCTMEFLNRGASRKVLAGDLFYLPVALAAFTRFGYLMRRSSFA